MENLELDVNLILLLECLKIKSKGCFEKDNTETHAKYNRTFNLLLIQ